jgi:DNA (cytosine-5)-methyltransferase 1
VKVGSLCTGILGAELAFTMMGLEPDLRWYSEIDPHARKVLARRVPDVPNLGDLKVIEWESVEPVDALVAGYPCQPFSHAGNRKGTDDPRHLWPWIACALRVLRPRYAFFENVAAHLGLGFDEVLSDLAAFGFDAEWTTLRASDVGACHQRDRLFIVATDTGGQ